MRIDNEFEVPAPVDQVWQYLLDVPRMAPCLPGAELTEIVDDNTYKGRVVTKLGPVSMRFSGTAHIVSKDEAAHKVVLNAEGAEEKGKGQASMAVTATLVRVGAGTKVFVSQDVEIAGAAAQFGRGMVADVAAVLMKSFARNVAEDITLWQRGEQRTVSATPAKGFSIWWRATTAALKRFFLRLFGRSR